MSKRKPETRKLILLIILAVLMLVLFKERALGPRDNAFHEARPVMGTIVQVDVCLDGKKGSSPELDRVMARVWERLEDIGWRMYEGNEGSDVDRLNKAGGSSVEVGPDTYSLLQTSLEMRRLTNGAFNVAVGSLMTLWQDAESAGRMPFEQDIADAVREAGNFSPEFLPGFHIRIPQRDVRLDFGGIAKGFALDEARRILLEGGFDRFMVDAGGDIVTHGLNCRGTSWRIGIRDPRHPYQMIDIVEVKGLAVTTSGDYEQSFEIAGRRWSHIIDPRSGFPVEEGLSVTVIAPTATEADALSTALSVLGPEEGLALIDRLGKEYAAVLHINRGGAGLRVEESRRYDDYRDQSTTAFSGTTE